MKTFKVSSGYIFNLYEPGDVCRVLSVEFFKTKMKAGTLVRVLTHPDDFSKAVQTINDLTGEKEEFSIHQLELVSTPSRPEPLGDGP
jgi:hypothetical protein